MDEQQIAAIRARVASRERITADLGTLPYRSSRRDGLRSDRQWIMWQLADDVPALLDALDEANAAKARAEHLNRRANRLLGSCWSLLQYVLSGHFPRPEIEDTVRRLAAWNEEQAANADAH